MEGDLPYLDETNDPGATDYDRNNAELTDLQYMGQRGANMEPTYEDIDQDGGFLDPEMPLQPYSEDVNNAERGLEETLEDEMRNNSITAAEVEGWDPKQTADYLRQMGVDPAHCEIIQKEEITGHVLLKMEQSDVKSGVFGGLGKSIPTAEKILQFQEEVKAGNLDAKLPSSVVGTVEEAIVDDIKPLQIRSLRPPFQWQNDMKRELRIKESCNVPPADLLLDLSPKWVDKHPTFLKTITAPDPSRDDVGVISSHESAQFLSRIGKDEPRAVERATISMCAAALEKFNGHRKLNKYRAR